MLDGKELEVAIGEYGSASVDVTDKGVVELAVSVKVDLLAELKKLAAKTSTPIDDAAIAWVEGMLGK